VAIISRAVTTSFPDASVFPFGSYATKLYLPLG
jgi:DNA polymerase sigma